MSDEKQPTPEENLQAILDSPSYSVAEMDDELLKRPELRGIRLYLELKKPELEFQKHGIRTTIVLFGGTRIVAPEVAEERLEKARTALAADPGDTAAKRTVAVAERIAAKSHYYEVARAFARLVSSRCQRDGIRECVIVTGGGPGIMEAANRGAFEIGAKSIGLNITIPREQVPNSYISPELCFQFHYFALRKMHFLMRARAMVACPGGYGTLDELFETLTLIQTGKMRPIPIVLLGEEYWSQLIDFEYLADEGTIDRGDLDLFSYAETPEEIWERIMAFYGGDPLSLLDLPPSPTDRLSR